MSHKDEIAEFLKKHPNQWFFRKDIIKAVEFPKTNCHKYLKRLIYWDDHFEEKVDEESGLLIFRYRSEV